MEIQHTLVLVNSRFCSLTACLKNEKCNRTKCNLWRNGEIQAKTKIQSAFLEVMEKYQNTKVQSNYKKDKINMHAIAQKYKMQKKIRTNNSKIHNRKTYKPKISNIQNTNKIQIQKWARKPTPCSFWKARTNLQNKCKANLLYFLNSAIQILYFSEIIELYFFVCFFFVFLILYRRPFCSQRSLLKTRVLLYSHWLIARLDSLNISIYIYMCVCVTV